MPRDAASKEPTHAERMWLAKRLLKEPTHAERIWLAKRLLKTLDEGAYTGAWLESELRDPFFGAAGNPFHTADHGAPT